MPLTLLLGGARSGKSALAVELAGRWEGPVAMVVTAEARDAEMAERVRRHRAGRPAGWRTLEEPLELEAALAEAPRDAAVVVDCLTLWVSNLMERGLSDEQVVRRARSVTWASVRPFSTRLATHRVRQSTSAQASEGTAARAASSSSGSSTVDQPAGRAARWRRTRSAISASLASPVTTTMTGPSQRPASRWARADLPLRAPPSSRVRAISSRSPAGPPRRCRRRGAACASR